MQYIEFSNLWFIEAGAYLEPARGLLAHSHLFGAGAGLLAHTPFLNHQSDLQHPK